MLRQIHAKKITDRCRWCVTSFIARRIERGKIFHADRITIESLAERVAEIFDMSSSALWIAGKHRWRVRAKSVFCYWTNRELAVSMSELSRRMNISVMAISTAVQRGEKIVKEFDISFY